MEKVKKKRGRGEGWEGRKEDLGKGRHVAMITMRCNIHKSLQIIVPTLKKNI